jgi:hypothetical protein
VLGAVRVARTFNFMTTAEAAQHRQLNREPRVDIARSPTPDSPARH